MRTVIIKTPSLSRFHFGKQAIDNKTGLADTSDWMSSDALFAALVNNVAKYNSEKAGDFISLFENNKVRISSLFYCLDNGKETIYFLPKPINASTKLPEKMPYTEIKRIKKVRLLSKSVLETYGEGWVKHLDNLVVLGGIAMVLKSEYQNYRLNEIDRLYNRGIATHINTRPVEEEGKQKNNSQQVQNELFQTAYIQSPMFKNWKSFFYFLIEEINLNENEKKLLNFSIKLIRFEGIGGKRNTGYGWVDDVEFNSKVPFSWKAGQAQKAMTIGLFIPRDYEEFIKLDAYELTQRGGRKIDRNTTLKVVNMITEGALIKGNNTLEGRIADISPTARKNKFLRLGTCITLPLKAL